MIHLQGLTGDSFDQEAGAGRVFVDGILHLDGEIAVDSAGGRVDKTGIIAKTTGYLEA